MGRRVQLLPEPDLPRRAVVHDAGLRPCPAQPQRADAAVSDAGGDVVLRRLCHPGRGARPGPGRRIRHRRGPARARATFAPDDGGPGERATAVGRACRARSGHRAPVRCRDRRAGLHRSALGAVIFGGHRHAAPRVGAVRGRRRRDPDCAQPGHRACRPPAHATGRGGRRPGLPVRRVRHPLRRLRPHHGHGRHIDRPLAVFARRHAGSAEPGQPTRGGAGRRRQVRAAVLPVGNSGPGRLARGARRTQRRSHFRRVLVVGPGAGTGRGHHRRLAPHLGGEGGAEPHPRSDKR